MLDYNLSTMEESVLEARQNRWFELNFANIDQYIRSRLVVQFKVYDEQDQDELAARAACHAIEQVRKKAYIDKEDGGWGSSSHDIELMLKARLKFYLLDEVPAFFRGSFGRGTTDFYDAATQADNVMELEDGETVNLVENQSVGMYNINPDSEQLLIWKQMFELIQSVADNTKDGDVLLRIVTGKISQVEACNETGIATSTMNDMVRKFRRDLEAALVAKGYIKGEDF